MWYYQLYHYDSSSFIGVFHTTSGGVGGEEPHTKSWAYEPIGCWGGDKVSSSSTVSSST